MIINTTNNTDNGSNIPNGRIDMTFCCDPYGRTYIDKQFSTYPFHICRAQYMDELQPNMATMYLQSCSGGIFEDDRLTLDFQVMKNAQAHITTQASTIVHRMEQRAACQEVRIFGEKGSIIEYIPDNNILFPGAKMSTSTIITRHPECDVIIGDSFLVHDPENKEDLFSWFKNELIVCRPDGKIDVTDRFSISGEQFRRGETKFSEGYKVHGTYAVLTNRTSKEHLAKVLRSNTKINESVYAGVSLLPNNTGCWVRYLASDGDSAKKFLISMWEETRRTLTGHSPSLRKK